VIVEFMGLSGSGKSTLVAEVGDLLGGGVRLVDASRDVPHDGYRAIVKDHPLISVRTLGATVVRSRGRCLPTRTGRLLVMGAIRQQVALARHHGAPLVLLDEGVIHYVWRKQMTLDEDLSGEVLERIAPELVDAVVHVEVEPEVARSRIAGKPNIGSVQRRLLAREPGSPAWVRATETYRALGAAVEGGLEPGRYLRVGNDGADLPGTARKVADHLHELVSGIAATTSYRDEG
jgi:hypothetical protein